LTARTHDCTAIRLHDRCIAILPDDMMERLGDHTRAVSLTLRGMSFTRLAVAQAVAGRRGGLLAARDYARRWRDTPRVAELFDAMIQGFDPQTEFEQTVTRAAVGAGNVTTWASALVQYQHVAAEFVDLLRPATLLGRLAGVRRVPFEITYPRLTGGATVGWTGAGAPAPVSELAFESAQLGLAKATGIVVVTTELARLARPAGEALVRSELLKAAAQFLDRQFIDPAVAAVSDTSPASVTHGVTPTQSSGSTATAIAADLGAMVATMADADVPFSAPFWIMRGSDAARLAAKRDTAGGPAFPDVRVNGGTLLGIPVLTTNGVPASLSGGSIVVLIDAAAVDVADEGMATIDTSSEAALQMQSAPSQGEQQAVSLWQSNMTALRVTAFANWRMRHAEAIAVLDNVHW
jgi:HK97 family phage major capsid protein